MDQQAAGREPIGRPVFDEAVQLRQSGPGKVVLLPTTSITFAGALRTAKETLDRETQTRVETDLSKIETALQGIEGATTTSIPAPVMQESVWKLIMRALISPLTVLTGGRTTAIDDHNRMVAASGVGPLQKPPPRELVRAAEGRLVADAARDGIDDETFEALTLPWQSATITS
ncbi:MAG: hypothetical protein GY750_21190 [Lentisphaerae bacterium]|nr:hypothetical protein [Lentisphaerota bacterium]